MSNHYDDLVGELVRAVQEFKDDPEQLQHALDEFEQRFARSLNSAYAQGVRDATKARTGRDPKVEKVNHDA